MQKNDRQLWIEKITRALEQLKQEGGSSRTLNPRDGVRETNSSANG